MRPLPWLRLLILVQVTLFVLVKLVSAGETERVDLFNRYSERLGYAEVDKSGRFELFDKYSRRLGHGKVDSTGRLSTYNNKSETVEPSKVAPRGKGKR